MYLLFNGALANIMGQDATSNWSKNLGLSNTEFLQFNDGEQTLIKVTDETIASKYFNHNKVEKLTVEEANQKIDTLFIPKYGVYNEALMNANLNQKISKGEINLDEMQAEWTSEQEAEWLYKKGISGIRKSEKPVYFS